MCLMRDYVFKLNKKKPYSLQIIRLLILVCALNQYDVLEIVRN